MSRFAVALGANLSEFCTLLASLLSLGRILLGDFDFAVLYTTTEHYEWARWAVDSSAALAGWGGRALLRATPPVVGRATDLLAAGGATSCAAARGHSRTFATQSPHQVALNGHHLLLHRGTRTPQHGNPHRNRPPSHALRRRIEH